MAINLKAKETLVRVGKYMGTYRYILSPVIYNRLSETKVIQEASLRSGINRGTINAVWDAIGSVIQAWATEGHSVAVPGLGTMRFGVRAFSASSVNRVSSDLINSRRVIFTPSAELRRELKNTSVSISCYNRLGKLVKTVNSEGDLMGDFEIELLSSPEEGGTFEGAGYYNDGDQAVIKAIPAEGYRFVKWNDDETDAERSVSVSSDASFVATFKKIDGSDSGSGSGGSSSGGSDNGGSNGGSTTKYTLTVTSADSAQGTVTGGGTYAAGSQVTITASPAIGYKFSQWSDGNTSSSRQVTVNGNMTLTATFVLSTTEEGGGDDDMGM